MLLRPLEPRATQYLIIVIALLLRGAPRFALTASAQRGKSTRKGAGLRAADDLTGTPKSTRCNWVR